MSNAHNSPDIVTAEIPAVSRDYAYRWLDLGAIEGALGDMKFTPELAEIVEAIHHVLAGGRVEVEIEEPGAAPIVDELESMLLKMLREGVSGGPSNSPGS